MKIGIFSDTHGNLPRTRLALEAFRQENIGHLIHCGDLGGEEIVTLLFETQENGLPLTAVPGNVDEWDPGLMMYAKNLGIPLHRIARLSVDELHIAVYHGHDPREWDALLTDADLAVIFTGHTHEPSDRRENGIRIINPGAIHRARVPGYGIFDTADSSWVRKELQGI